MRPLAQAKRPVTALAGPYGHPLHPAIVPIPIGAWTASLAFDIASRAVDDPTFLAPASRWLIAVGVLGAVAAAAVGLLDLLAIPARSRARFTALTHLALNLAATAGYAVGFALRGGAGSGDRVGWGPLALSAFCLALVAGAGYLGGELVFRYGVRVVDESEQVDGFAGDRTSKEEL